MKYLFVFLLLGLMVSCGGSDASGDAEEKQVKFSTVKIGRLEVMTKDLGKMEWDDAMKACADLGDGWRLPTKDELLNILYENKDEIGGFATSYYWSSTEYDNSSAWGRSFANGNRDYSYKYYAFYVRAVRAF